MAKRTGFQEIDDLSRTLAFEPESIAFVLSAVVENITEPAVVQMIGEERAKRQKIIRLFNRTTGVWGWLIIDPRERCIMFSTEVQTQVLQICVTAQTPEDVEIKPTGKTAMTETPLSLISFPKIAFVKARPESGKVFFVAEKVDCCLILEINANCQHKVYFSENK